MLGDDQSEAPANTGAVAAIRKETANRSDRIFFICHSLLFIFWGYTYIETDLPHFVDKIFEKI